MIRPRTDKIIITRNPKPGNAGPPNPFRFDWEARYEPDDSEGHYAGLGGSPEEALGDLRRLDEEDADACEERERLNREANGLPIGEFYP